ncbi:MAG: peptidyl-prolyl cis-trans isomerase [Candidatus Azobacteroides sp.]|nr:peptidyl-prolyl cis-trans isomerase [Candidatus Azobacteroides sp.]
MRYFFSLIIVSLLTVACSNNLELVKSGALVKVGNKVLYRSVLEENMPIGLSSEDSIIAAEHFIRSWINENLLYDIASRNINDKENIEYLVENYRKSLLIYQYQEQLVNERLTKGIDEQALFDYYNQNKDKLKLENPLIKGVFLKVPVNAPQLEEIRTWYKSKTSVSRENLEKYSLNNVAIYNYFVDNWVDFNDLLNNFPQDQLNKEDFSAQKKTIEKQDKDYFYFLNITDCLLAGENAPYEYAKATIQEILINQRKIEFLKKMEEDLYKRALDKGEIQFYGE